jgi:hypothetical protein
LAAGICLRQKKLLSVIIQGTKKITQQGGPIRPPY